MKYAIFYSLQAPPEFGVTPQQVYAEALEQIARADELGLHQVWLTEHHFMDDAYCPSPMIAAAAIAGRTKQIRIGQGVVLLPFYGHPLKLAEDAAVLDVLSGGRFELGIGRGYRPHEFAGFGMDQKERVSRTNEGIEIIRKSWAGERFSHSGKYYQVHDARLMPAPVQNPMRLWLGAGTPSSRRKVAQKGLPLLISLVTNLEETIAEFADYTQSLLEFGHDPSHFPRALIREFYVADDSQRAWEEVKPYFLHVYQKVYCPPWVALYDTNADGSRRRVRDPHDPYIESDRFRKDRHIIGDPEACARELRRYKDEAKIDIMILRMQFPGQPMAQVMQSLDMLVNEVSPLVER